VITIEQNPVLLDYIKVALQMPEDERKQLENFTGHPFDIDGCAMGNFQVQGHKWVIRSESGQPLVVGGFARERPGVWRDFLLTTPAAFKAHGFQITRICRRVMDAMFLSGEAHRIECIAPASREHVFRWYATLGYNKEAVLHGYCADGSDAVIFSRVQH
jgi:hypothetical protein